MSGLLDEWLSEGETAAEIKKSLRTIRQWRKVGKGPPYARFGRTIKYRKSAIAEHFRSSEIDPSRAARRRAGTHN
jgi:hypothetical protein